jgi:hypothetical protein
MKCLIVGILCLIVGLGLGLTSRQLVWNSMQVVPQRQASTGNSRVIYGDNGPKNCRALIKDSIEGYLRKDYTADDTLFSLDRNCGEFGYAWDEGEPTKRPQCLAVMRRWRKEAELGAMCNALAD